MLDTLVPTPRLLEVDHVDLAAPPGQVWERLRHGNLATSPLVRALFELRAVPERLRGKHSPLLVHFDDLRSSREQPGFQILGEVAPHEIVVGAIGRVWELEIPFVHVENAAEFEAFEQAGYVKVAWAVRVVPHGERDSRVVVEVRVDATDDAAWRKFKAYFLLIGPGSRFIRHALLAGLARELGTPEAAEQERPLPGDELLPDAGGALTHGVTIAATPERIWPWLLQLGCRRAGFYAVDWLDNGGERSARELHPELMSLEKGQVLPATPDSDEGFEVLRVEPNRVLVLGGLFDSEAGKQLPFASARPNGYWHVSWAFVLEPLDAATTRVHVRARAAFPPSGRLHVTAIRPVHRFMQSSMLRHLAARVEGRLPRDDARDVRDGIEGAALILSAFLTPFLRSSREHWGLSRALASRAYPGDELVGSPRWGYTHAVEIGASAERVWPWLAQIGADRAGFYSYQWLENLVGCEVQNAETIHPEWEAKVGQKLLLHPDPKAPNLEIVSLERGRYVLAFAAGDPHARELGRPWVSTTWLFYVEPIDAGHCRFISRFRGACSDDLATRLAFGPPLLEPVGFAMDRRMLLGLKERAERAERPLPNRRLA